MSTYTHRLFEGKFPILKGNAYSLEEIAEKIDQYKEGDTFLLYGNQLKHKYYRIENGDLVGVDKIDYEWRALQPLVPIDYKPARARYKTTDENGNEVWKFYNEHEDRNIVEIKSGIETYLFKKYDMYANNGGAIRDEYISTRGFGVDTEFQGRGFPDDMSDETKKTIYDEDGKFLGWDATYVTVGEWTALYDKEEERILSKLKDAYAKEYNTAINKKLDFIIDHMKDPLSADKKVLQKSLETEKDEEGNEMYDITVNEIIEEYMPNLYSIAHEIGMANTIKDMYELYDYDGAKFRIIYFLG